MSDDPKLKLGAHEIVGSASGDYIEVVKVVHLQSGAGTARCGRPAKLEDIRNWGDEDVNCERCILAYAAAARLRVNVKRS